MADNRPTPPLPDQQQDQVPGRTGPMDPKPDHGEQSYKGSGRLAGKKAVITGGDSGIGRAVAIAFAREGADVLIAYLDEDDDAAETAKWVEQAGRQVIRSGWRERRPTVVPSSRHHGPHLRYSPCRAARANTRAGSPMDLVGGHARPDVQHLKVYQIANLHINCALKSQKK